jgi:hypothetical protein
MIAASSDRLALDAPQDVAVAFARETQRRAEANRRLALSNFDNLPPWRWRTWWRVYRSVNAEIDVIEARNAASNAWRDARRDVV